MGAGYFNTSASATRSAIRSNTGDMGSQTQTQPNTGSSTSPSGSQSPTGDMGAQGSAGSQGSMGSQNDQNKMGGSGKVKGEKTVEPGVSDIDLALGVDGFTCGHVAKSRWRFRAGVFRGDICDKIPRLLPSLREGPRAVLRLHGNDRFIRMERRNLPGRLEELSILVPRTQ